MKVMAIGTLKTLALLTAFAASFPQIASAQAAPGASQAAAALALPDVPTTRILAIGRLTAKSTPAAVAPILPQEVRDTVKLYLGGKIDQWYVRKDSSGVVFILNMTDTNEARDMLAQLPLGRAHLMEFDLIPLGPLSPLAALAAPGTH